MIGVVVALDKELKHILDGLEDVKECEYCGKKFFEGEIGGKRLVLALSGIGKVNAAYTATLMIVKYSPEYLINTGIAGGLKKLPQASVMVVESAVQYDCDTTAFGDPPGMLNVNGEEKVYFETDGILRKALANAIGKNAFYGRVATGDRFVSDTAFCTYLREKFGASACDMECGAIAEVAYIAGTKWCAIKVISDSADDSAENDYNTFAEKACVINANAVLNCLKAL